MTLRPSLAVLLVSLAGIVQAEPLPQSTSDWTRKRAPKAPAADLFGARPPAAIVKRPVQPMPAPPAPPPFPYTYGGSGRIGGVAFVFLEQKDRTVLARIGDIVDRAYRIEAIESDRAVLRYLPLEVAQVMIFGSGTAPSRPVAATAPPPPARSALFLHPPDELPLGQEFPLALGIPPGSAAVRATIQLVYDAEVLSLSGARIDRPGKALVELSAQDASRTKEIRLRAIAETTMQTEIGIAVTAFDAQGKSVEVRGIPAVHLINLTDERG